MPTLPNTEPAPPTGGPGGGSTTSRDADETFRAALDAFRRRLDDALAEWIEARRREAAAEAAQSAELAAEVGRLVAGGGKRLRPALVDAAYRACGGRSDEAVLALAMATELLHTYLLIHDDIMDHAAVRRGEPTAHEVFAARHRERSWPGDAADYGRSVAILVGDLAHTWAAMLSRTSSGAEGGAEGDPRAVAASFDAMSREVIGGQYLEMTLPFRLGGDPRKKADRPTADELLRALRLKSGRYSIERPLELGALLAGAAPEIVAGLRSYGEAVGDAFQLQDDVLGTFGEATAVGKPVASDLEEGKYTFLIHHTLAGADPADGRWLSETLVRGGLTAEEVARARRVIRGSGGLAAVEAMIDERLDRGRQILSQLPFSEEHAELFLGLIDYLARRDR